jgi:invasion protein IalB
MRKISLCQACLLSVFFAGFAYAQSKQPAASPQPAAPAQTATPTKEGARWVSHCASESRKAPLDCSVDAVVPIPNTPQLALNISIQVKPGKARPVFRFVTPLAVLLEPGVNLTFENGPSRRLTFEYCEQRGCLASAELSPEMIDALRNGTSLTASFQTATQQNFDVLIPTNGLGAMISKIE